jgi:formylglycine-generating enzyme required for sulfatase activity
MIGKVWEWVNDWYDPGYYRVSPVKNLAGSSSGEHWGARGAMVRTASCISEPYATTLGFLPCERA